MIEMASPISIRIFFWTEYSPLVWVALQHLCFVPAVFRHLGQMRSYTRIFLSTQGYTCMEINWHSFLSPKMCIVVICYTCMTLRSVIKMYLNTFTLNVPDFAVYLLDESRSPGYRFFIYSKFTSNFQTYLLDMISFRYDHCFFST